MMTQILAWIFAGIPSVLVAAVSAHRLFIGESAWWLLGLILAGVIAPTSSKDNHS